MDKKGFTLVELLAVIVIATAIVLPLLSAFIGNFSVNERMHDRRAASSLGDATIEMLNKVDYADLVDHLNDSGDPAVRLIEDDCDGFTDDTGEVGDENGEENEDDEVVVEKSSQDVCGIVFDQQWSGITFAEADFHIYYVSYLIWDDEDALADIEEMEELPEDVRQAILQTDPEQMPATPNFLRAYIWIDYAPDVNQSLLVEGDISRD